MLVTNDLLQVNDFLICISDDSNQEVKHDNKHEKGLGKPAHPNEPHVDVPEH